MSALSAASSASAVKQLALASANAGKLRELSGLLAAQNIAVIGQSELGIAAIAETGLTFVENALLKARHVAVQLASQKHQPMPVLADDSGLVVPALDGAPGLYSARYAGVGASDADNNRLLLDNLSALKGQTLPGQALQVESRRAWFHCTLVCLHHADDPDPLIAVARWHGHIAERCSGTHGFGYDPLFVPQGMTASAAEMAPTDKSARSHRGQALQQLLASLPEWW